MTRMIDNPLVWRGSFDMPNYDCGRVMVFANALQRQ